jgi:hypothetical protein
MPTGWRPADVAEKYPVYKIADVYHFEKYGPAFSKVTLIWSGFQLVITLLLISYLFGNIAAIGSPGMFVYGGFIFLMVYAYTEFMDGSAYAGIWETFKNLAGLFVIGYTGDWFGSDNVFIWIKYFLIVYLVLATIITNYLVYSGKRTLHVSHTLAS